MWCDVEWYRFFFCLCLVVWLLVMCVVYFIIVFFMRKMLCCIFYFVLVLFVLCLLNSGRVCCWKSIVIGRVIGWLVMGICWCWMRCWCLLCLIRWRYFCWMILIVVIYCYRIVCWNLMIGFNVKCLLCWCLVLDISVFYY